MPCVSCLLSYYQYMHAQHSHMEVFRIFACVCGAAIAETMGQTLYFNTYGGNPMASAVGSAVMDVSVCWGGGVCACM